MNGLNKSELKKVGDPYTFFMLNNIHTFLTRANATNQKLAYYEIEYSTYIGIDKSSSALRANVV